MLVCPKEDKEKSLLFALNRAAFQPATCFSANSPTCITAELKEQPRSAGRSSRLLVNGSVGFLSGEAESDRTSLGVLESLQ